MKYFILLITTSLLFSCVTKKKYRALEEEKNTLTKEVTNLNKKIEGLSEQNEMFTKKLSELSKHKEEGLDGYMKNPPIGKQPQFPGGERAMFSYVAKNVQYPKEAMANNVEGKVYVQFVVDTDGSIKDVTVIRGVSKECDAEAVRVIKAMPNWIPGSSKGKNVKVKQTLPIMFKLR